jgi:hypothetical protein
MAKNMAYQWRGNEKPKAASIMAKAAAAAA